MLPNRDPVRLSKTVGFSMTKTTLIKTIATIVLLAHTAAAPSLVKLVEEDELLPSSAHARATELITYILSTFHYKKTKLDDELSAQILDRYLESLDPSRYYFLTSDVKEFHAEHRTEIDNYLNNKRLKPIYQVFIRYRNRLSERTDYAISLLDQTHDFSIEEVFEFDRDEALWANSSDELNELWRKRVKNDILSLRLSNKDAEATRETLMKRYQGLERRTKQLDGDDVFQLFINAYTTSIEPHTAYFSPRTSENFKIRMSLSLEGIGAVLQSDDQFTLVREIVAGGPADKSDKLHSDDRIIGVGQDNDGEVLDVIGWRLDDVVDLIRGPKDSVVRLEILRKGVGPEGPSDTISITRNKIELEEQAAKRSLLQIPTEHGELKIGVVTIPTFYLDFEGRSRGTADYRSTTRDVRKMLAELKNENIDGLLIDLRSNGGGSLSEATELTGLFIEEGPVVQVRDSKGEIQYERDRDPAVEYAGPLAVLVDRASASASEIFAGAIQDYGRGVILGEPTFGKGTVQNLIDLNRNAGINRGRLGQLKATIAQFFRVSGASTQHRGVIPDIEFATTIQSDDHGESALDNALPWDQIAPASFVPIAAGFRAQLPYAIAQHQARVKHDDGFQVLLEEARLVKEARDRTQVSLVEEQRRLEQQETRKTNHDLQNRLRVARGLEPLPEPDITDEHDEVASAQTDNETEQDSEDEPKPLDIVLNEAAAVLADLINPSNTQEAGAPGYSKDYATRNWAQTPVSTQ